MLDTLNSCKTLSFLFPEVSTELLHHIDQYIELIEIVEEVSAVIKLENVKETFDTARKLRESIVNFDDKQNEEMNCNVRTEQSKLAQKLQTALFELQVQVLDNTHELASSLSAYALQRIAQVTAQLQANLVAITSVQILVQAPAPLTEIPTPIEISQSHFDAATTSRPVVDNIIDSESIEEAESINKETLKEHSIAHTDVLENITKATQDDVVAVEDVKLKKSSESSIASLKDLNAVKSCETLDITGAQASQIEDSDSFKTLDQSKVALSTVQSKCIIIN